MNTIFVKVKVVRNPVITTVKHNSKEETIVMFVGKVIAPVDEASNENIVFYYRKEMFFHTDFFNSINPIFSAIATSKENDIVILQTRIENYPNIDRCLSGDISNDYFYNKITYLGSDYIQKHIKI